MTPFLSVPLALALTALLWLTLLAVVIGTALLLLLALLALDVLLDRNGVDRRAGVLGLWRRLRRPTPTPRRQEAAAEEPPARTTPRIPFSARRPTRPAQPEATVEPVAEQAPPEPATAESVVEEPVVVEPEQEQPAAIALAESPTPASDAVTEVLSVPTPPEPRSRAPRAPRAPRSAPPRPTPRRTPTPEPAPAPEPESEPVDRDSAMERLFAPLLESDRTEPLPRTTRPVRRPRDDA